MINQQGFFISYYGKFGIIPHKFPIIYIGNYHMYYTYSVIDGKELYWSRLIFDLTLNFEGSSDDKEKNKNRIIYFDNIHKLLECELFKEGLRIKTSMFKRT